VFLSLRARSDPKFGGTNAELCGTIWKRSSDWYLYGRAIVSNGLHRNWGSWRKVNKISRVALGGLTGLLSTSNSIIIRMLVSWTTMDWHGGVSISAEVWGILDVRARIVQWAQGVILMIVSTGVPLHICSSNIVKTDPQ